MEKLVLMTIRMVKYLVALTLVLWLEILHAYVGPWSMV